mmetsp:Transcript_43205/g.85187  ORF Transcript_43205/g.85187 Transcript_43205/m.85187 type:complete len:291 (+) Transcript_43205:147-1019(+)
MQFAGFRNAKRIKISEKGRLASLSPSASLSLSLSHFLSFHFFPSHSQPSFFPSHPFIRPQQKESRKVGQTPVNCFAFEITKAIGRTPKEYRRVKVLAILPASSLFPSNCNITTDCCADGITPWRRRIKANKGSSPSKPILLRLKTRHKLIKGAIMNRYTARGTALLALFLPIKGSSPPKGRPEARAPARMSAAVGRKPSDKVTRAPQTKFNRPERTTKSSRKGPKAPKQIPARDAIMAGEKILSTNPLHPSFPFALFALTLTLSLSPSASIESFFPSISSVLSHVNTWYP